MLVYDQLPRAHTIKASSDYALTDNRYTLAAFGDIQFKDPVSTAVKLDDEGNQIGKIRKREIAPLKARFSKNPNGRSKLFVNWDGFIKT